MASSRGKISLAEHRLRHHAPNLAEDRVRALGAIWDEVVGRIIRTMLARDDDYKPDLHVNVRAEMTNLLAHMSLFLTERVIDQRLGERRPEDIDPQAEPAACFDAAGLADIEGTAANAHVVWRRRLDERWVPKSRKALDREASPPPPPPPPKPIAVKPVADKHFISKWFIRDHWAQGQTATRWRRAGDGWSRATIPFGRWAYRQHLWSDRLEAYFALIEGEAKRPVLGYRCSNARTASTWALPRSAASSARYSRSIGWKVPSCAGAVRPGSTRARRAMPWLRRCSFTNKAGSPIAPYRTRNTAPQASTW